jgi:hypothetical protein
MNTYKNKIYFSFISGKQNSFCPMKSRGRISSPGTTGHAPVFTMTFKLKTFSLASSRFELGQIVVLASNEIISAISHSPPYEYTLRASIIRFKTVCSCLFRSYTLALFTCSIIECPHKNISDRKRCLRLRKLCINA